MITYLRRNQQAFIVYIVLYCILIIFLNQILFLKDVKPEEYFNGSIFFYFFDINILSKTPPYLLTIFSIIGILFIGFYLVRISINNLIIQTRSQFPALFVVIISSLIFQAGIFSMSIIGAIFLLIAFDRLIASMEKQNLNFRYIDGGILLAIGSLFYMNLILFLPFLWVAQIIIRKINSREVLFTVVGFLVPYIYVLSGAYLYNFAIPEIFRQIYFTLTTPIKNVYDWEIIVGISIFLAFTIYASIFAILKFGSKKIQTRKLYQLLFYLFIICLVIFILLPSGNFELFIISSIPLSVLFSIYFTECAENLFNSIFLIILILVPPFLIVAKWLYN
jgi:hypothetical protein